MQDSKNCWFKILGNSRIFGRFWMILLEFRSKFTKCKGNSWNSSQAHRAFITGFPMSSIGGVRILNGIAHYMLQSQDITWNVLKKSTLQSTSRPATYNGFEKSLQSLRKVEPSSTASVTPRNYLWNLCYNGVARQFAGVELQLVSLLFWACNNWTK